MSRKKMVMPVMLILLFTAMYISLIFNKNIWTDEAYTIELVRENSFPGIIRNTAVDVHPPLYYLIAKCFVLLLGDAFWVYKAVSIVPMVLTMVLVCLFGKLWRSEEETTVLAIVMLNAVPCVLEYAVQIRMYSWALFFVTWAGLSAYAMCVSDSLRMQKNSCIQLTAACILGCYTHTYAMLSCVCIDIILCIYALLCGMRRQDYGLLKKCLVSGCVVSVCYLPWLVVLVRQTMSRIENYWIDPVTWEVIRQYPGYLFASRLPGSAALYLILCGAAVLICVRLRREGIAALLMLAVPVMTALIGIVVSIVVTPFFIARYLVPCMGLFALFLALAFRREQKAVRTLLGVFGFLMVLNAYQKNFEMEYHSTHTDELLQYMDENLGQKDLIAYNFEAYGFIYNIYFPDRTQFLSDVDFAGDFDSIWYFDSCVTPWLDTQVLEQHGLEKEFVMTTGIEQNEFQLYHIRHKE